MDWLVRLLFDWVFVLFFQLLQGLLQLVHFVEQIFDVFAGTAKVSYNGQRDYLINVFFGQSTVATVFWGITAIAMVLCFAFTIVAVTRKTLDIGGTVKNSIGQIITNAGKACLTFLLLSFLCMASINLANVVLVQVNYLMKNANSILSEDPEKRTFTGAEYSAMTRIMNTISNYALSPSPNNRYNINACYNEIRGDLLYLYHNDFFDTYYGSFNDNKNWQSGLALIAGAYNIENELPLDEVNSSITNAITSVMNELQNNPDFRPVESVAIRPQEDLTMDNTIFLTSTLDAANSSIYRGNASFTDSLRRSYYDGSKSYMDLKQVRKDFDIWEVRYDIGYVSCIVFFVIMVYCIFIFIMRLFDLLLLYIAAPFFVSTMPLDDGQKFQLWRQAFIVKLVSGFGSVMAMRLYLMLIPIVMDSKLVFFEDKTMNYLSQMLFILAGAYAVLKATGLLTNIVAGTPGAAAQSEMMGAMIGGALFRRGGHMVEGAVNKTVGGIGSSFKKGGHAITGAIKSHGNQKKGNSPNSNNQSGSGNAVPLPNSQREQIAGTTKATPSSGPKRVPPPPPAKTTAKSQAAAASESNITPPRPAPPSPPAKTPEKGNAAPSGTSATNTTSSTARPAPPPPPPPTRTTTPENPSDSQ